MKFKLCLCAVLLTLPGLAFGAVVSAWGDSLTAGTGGTPYPTQFAALSGLTTNNLGVGGETSTQIMNRFLAQPARWGDFTVIWAGRNNVYSEPSVVEADIANMVSHLTTSNYLVLSVLNGNYGGYDSVGGAGYALITGLNDNLALTYGSKYIDIRRILVDSYNPSLPTDVSDFARDIVPTSLRSDAIHLNTAGYGIVASTVHAAVPEPSKVALMACAAATIGFVRLRKRRTSAPFPSEVESA